MLLLTKKLFGVGVLCTFVIVLKVRCGLPTVVEILSYIFDKYAFISKDIFA